LYSLAKTINVYYRNKYALNLYMETQNHILTEDISLLQPRRMLLPIWIKIFIWIFMVTGGLAPIIFLIGAFGGNFHASIFGLESTDPISMQSLLIICVFIYNGIIAYMLWTERKDAVTTAIYGAWFNVLICVVCMVMAIADGRFSFRIELVPLFFFISKLKKIKEAWLLGISKG
jgi:hypothetical protein